MIFMILFLCMGSLCLLENVQFFSQTEIVIFEKKHRKNKTFLLSKDGWLHFSKITRKIFWNIFFSKIQHLKNEKFLRDQFSRALFIVSSFS